MRFESLTDDTLMADAFAYFKNHGTITDRMWAHYLMGCVYRDPGQAPEALELFRDGIALADATRTDCDYHYAGASSCPVGCCV